jgi:prepilin-type N-terminal cleavage/methylation domain-containing protein
MARTVTVRLSGTRQQEGASIKAWRVSLKGTRGFTLAEVAVVVIVVGLIAAISVGAYSKALGNREVRTAAASAENISGAILAFTRLNNRLPCPDTDGDGREGDGAGVCPAAREVGFIPYESIGLDNPPTAERGAYGVYRNAGITADLVLPAATLNRTNLQRALISASNATVPPAGVSSGHVFITGNNASTGPENCGTQRVFHPAYVVVVPGSNKDGSGTNFDGIHAGLPGTGLCIASPDRVPNTVFDDRVVSISFTTLLGVISTDAP